MPLGPKNNSPGAARGHENYRRIYQFFRDHVGCSNRECAAALGLSEYAVGRHVSEIRKTWLPDGFAPEARANPPVNLSAEGAQEACAASDKPTEPSPQGEDHAR